MERLIKIFNKSKKHIGTFDTTDRTYHRVVNRKQMFVHPKYEGMLAISQDVQRRLAKMQCKTIVFTIMDWEKVPFDAIITFIDFLEHREELYFKGKLNSDKQHGVRLHFWTRRYKDQKVLK